MLQFRSLLRQALRDALARGKLSVEEQSAARKVLKTRGAFARFAVTMTSIRGYPSAGSRAKKSKSDKPWLDWIRANWIKILVALVTFALSLL